MGTLPPEHDEIEAIASIKPCFLQLQSDDPLTRDSDVSVLIIDQRRLFRSGLTRILEQAIGITVVGEERPCYAALNLVCLRKPDVIVFGIDNEHETTTRQMRALCAASERSRILAMLPNSVDSSYVRLLSRLVHGILGAESSSDDLLQAIRHVHKGSYHIAGEVARHLVVRHDETDQPSLKDLSAREMEVLLMTIDGLRPRDIALQMQVSPRTIGTFRYRIFKKLHVKTDAELVRLAMR